MPVSQNRSRLYVFLLIFLTACMMYIAGGFGFTYVYGKKATQHFCKEQMGALLNEPGIERLRKTAGLHSFYENDFAQIGVKRVFKFTHESHWVCELQLGADLRVVKADVYLLKNKN